MVRKENNLLRLIFNQNNNNNIWNIFSKLEFVLQQFNAHICNYKDDILFFVPSILAKKNIF